MKRVIIKYEKIWYKGKPMIKILGWNNIKKTSELPKEYFEEEPYFYCNSYIYHYNQLYHNNYFEEIEVRDKDGGTNFTSGSLINIKDWKRIIKAMRKSGERLHEILKKNKWQGKGKIII